MKDTFRRLRVRARERLESLRPSSDEVESPVIEGQVASDRISTDFRQQHSEITRQEDRVDVAAEPGDNFQSASQFGTNPSPIENIDGPSWANVWPEAYQNVKTDPEHSELLQKLQRFLESEGGRLKAADDVKLCDDPSGATDASSRLKTIQKNAEERLGNFSDAHLSFKIRDKPIVVRESIFKVVQVINTLKPVIGGAVATEPSAALAWAGITTILPMLENIFQQDEDAATGLTNIIFLMARYQGFHERDFASRLASPSESGVSGELLSRIRDELVTVYSKIYVYEARFVLQYGKRNKAHRALRNALNADDWKKSWSDIESISNRIDKGVTSQVNAAALETWKAVKHVQEHVAIYEAMQHETLQVVQGFDRRQLLQSLQITGNAVFDSHRTSRADAFCMPGTQRHILQTIQSWTDDPNGKLIFLLQGMAGTGKTSIALTVARSLEAKEPLTDPLKQPSKAFLGASFFFAQGDATRNNIAEFFRTIAWCLADVLPDVGTLIAKAIKDNPGIHTKASQQQLRKLIIDPLELLDRKTFVPLQLVIVIDALDECIDEDAEDLLGMLASLESLHQIQLRLFITSRREGHISTAMKNLPSRLYQITRLNKIESSPDNNDDIVFYLSKSLGSIATRWRVTDGGVTDDDINRLAENADGLFIYAATACRFLDSRHFVNKGFRERRLNLFFKDQWETEGPQHTIDDIYHKVLTFPETEDWSQEEQRPFYSEISQLIGFIVVLFRPASVETLSHLLPTVATENTTRDNLDYYLGQLHSIIDVPEDPGFPISLVHLSFREFILNEKRSERLPFSVNEIEMHRKVLHQCFELMNSELRENICCLSLPGSIVSDVEPSHISCHIPQYLQYACRYWVDHLLKSDRKLLAHTISEDAEDHSPAGLVYGFLKEKLLYWLEVMAFIGEAASIITMFSLLETSIELSTNPDLSSLLHDAKRFVLNNRWSIEHTPLQMYCSALLFCPKESLVRSYYQDMIPVWITKKPQTQQTWPIAMSTLEGHTDDIFGTAFSPTESLLASVSKDKTTRVWDYITGSEKYRFEDPGGPWKVCFSADGSKLASGCWDGTVRVRDIRKGTQVSFHTPSIVKGILFSPTSCNILASVFDDNMLYVWNIEDKRPGTALKLPHRGSHEHIAFSPDGKLVAVCCGFVVALCNVELGQLTHEFLSKKRLMGFDPKEAVRGLSISTDHRIVAVRFHKSIDFWEMTPVSPKLVRSYEATWSDNSLFLFTSPDEKIKIYQNHTQMVDVLDLTTGESIGTFLKSFVKQDSHDEPLYADSPRWPPLIRILSGPYTSISSDGEDSPPNNVMLLEGNNMALSYFSGKETRQWNATDGSMEAFGDHVRAAKCSPDRQFVLLQLNGGDEFQVWNSTLTQKIAAYEQLAYMDFLPQTSHLVSLSLLGSLQILYHDPKSLTFETVNSISLPDAHSENMLRGTGQLYVSPSGEVIAVILACDDGYHEHGNELLQVWNIPRKEKIKEIHCSRIRKIVFSPDSTYVGVEYGPYPRSTLLLRLSNGTEVVGCDSYDGGFLTFHPSGRMFGILSKDSTISLWKGTPWVKHFVFQVPGRFGVENLALSTTNKLVVFSISYEGRSIIEIWDTETRQKVGSQDLMFAGWALDFCFSKNENFIESNWGRIPLPTQDIADIGPDGPGDGLRNCLYVSDDWVCQGRERLIWLPPSYRPLLDWTRIIDVQGDTIAIAHQGNCVKFIGISLEETPVVKHYLDIGSR
ncbi:uncharacterized protein FPRO_12426 [Fusarium proliferatum ET1]|uniref:Uncharacterized protein n=1 Tax=Fusarium proliferatum (strain ET1) TaxID=1227346 RepID=A0A1L7W8R2_FUSPR|nr:uncharacterized protein FPRO_12426 [Fusarium proliferatum ET1]CZR48987.1 uncharacterized protein FPRO_12426 [Fusarium proliferatum ET1]